MESSTCCDFTPRNVPKQIRSATAVVAKSVDDVNRSSAVIDGQSRHLEWPFDTHGRLSPSEQTRAVCLDTSA